MHFALSYHRLQKVTAFLNVVGLFFIFLIDPVEVNSQTVTTPQSDSSFSNSFGHSESYSYTAADNEFRMVISRAKADVVISIYFADSLVFDYVSVERQPDFGQTFTQCKYITYNEVKTQGRHIVVNDTYPYPAATDVLYRIKIATKDGVMRTYPAINLPAVSK